MTARIPGTGVSFYQPLRAFAAAPANQPDAVMPLPSSPLAFRADALNALSDVRSADSQELTTQGLGEFKRLLAESQRECAEIAREKLQALALEKTAVARYEAWRDGWLMRRLFTTTFARLQEAADEATARRAELDEQAALARIQTQIEMPPDVAVAFHRMSDAFDKLSQSKMIWDTVGQRTANRGVERTTATRIVERKPVRFGRGLCSLIESEWKVPHLQNANGGDIYLYPAFVLYFENEQSFGLIEYTDVRLEFNATSFLEQEPVPPDALVIGHDWAKANKDGSPDLRFKDNYQIPVAQYGNLMFLSGTGMNEEYMASNATAAAGFSDAWEGFVTAVRESQ